MIIETFRQALQNVWSNKLRTFLTMLGIIIGVMAVIVIVGLGNGMTQSMRDSFSALGTNALSIQVWGYGSRTASVEDVYKIADKNKELISAVSPQIDFSNNTPKVGTTTYRYGTSVYGVDEHYAEMKNYTLAQGRGLQYMDIKDNKQVCIIGDYLNRAAYGGNAVGQTIKLGAYKFRIVGVLNAKVTDKNMQQGSDDDCIYLPYTTAMRLSNQSSAKNFVAIMTDESRANEAKAVVESGLYDLLKSDNAYYIYSASEWLEEMNEMINMVIIILTGIASISLLVGGIGIMNIMLVSVTERTREIGIRKSLGAKRKDIRGQFIIEAGTTSAIGGVLGILVGIGLASLAGSLIGGMMTSSMGGGSTFSAVPNLSSVAVAFGVSVGIGILFGYLPEEMQRLIAAKLNVPVSRVYGVVTFYTFFTMTPKGKHPISVCMGTACYVRGSEKLLEEFKRVLGIEVGETTQDGKFSLDCLRCVGACGLAPVVMIGEKVYGRLQAVDVKKVLEELE